LPEGAVKRNSLFNHIIKNYKYSGGKSPDIKPRLKVFQSGQFPSFALPEFGVKKRKRPTRDHSADRGAASPAARMKNAAGTSDCDTRGDIRSNVNSASYEDEKMLSELRSEFEIKLQQETKLAFNRGVHDGRQQGIAEWTPQAQRISQALDRAIAEINRHFKSFFDEIEHSVTDLSLFLAEKIIGEAAARVPDAVKANVDKCLALLAGSGKVTIKISPSDYDIIKAHLPELGQVYEGKFSFSIEPDQSITMGGCLVDLNGSLVDGRIETQIANIVQHVKMLS